MSQEDLEEALGYFEYAVAAYYVQVNTPKIAQTFFWLRCRAAVPSTPKTTLEPSCS